MDHRSRSWIQRRLRSLAGLELLNIPLQAVVWFGILDFPVTPANAAGFGLFVLLLLEGAAYWTAKLRQFSTSSSTLPAIGVFAVARWTNVLMLAAGLLFVGWAVARDPGTGTWLGLGLALFAVLEHVNYFHIQLMYDNAEDLRYLRRRGLRRAQLARDLATQRLQS